MPRRHAGYYFYNSLKFKRKIRYAGFREKEKNFLGEEISLVRKEEIAGIF